MVTPQAMPAPPAPEAFAALCEKEREILRLLARGHTAKSIAQRLDRSEGAINERLREARRKTGFGSSRELARVFAAQEIGDEEIDLTRQSEAGDPGTALRTVELDQKKGSIPMIIATPMVAMAAMLLSSAVPATTPGAGSEAAASTSSPLAGRWALDVDGVPESERPRSVIIAFSPARDGRWTTRVSITASDGSVQEGISTAAADGTLVPVSGFPFIDSASLRHPSANSLVMTLAKGGAPVSTRVYTVAADGRSMTETIVWAGQAVPRLETNRFTRID